MLLSYWWNWRSCCDNYRSRNRSPDYFPGTHQNRKSLHPEPHVPQPFLLIHSRPHAAPELPHRLVRPEVLSVERTAQLGVGLENQRRGSPPPFVNEADMLSVPHPAIPHVAAGRNFVAESCGGPLPTRLQQSISLTTFVPYCCRALNRRKNPAGALIPLDSNDLTF